GSPRASAAVALMARMPTRWRDRAGAPRFDEGGAPSPCSPEVCALHATPRVRIAVAAESSLLRAFQDVHPSTLGEDYCLGGTGIRNSESEHHVGRLRDAELVAPGRLELEARLAGDLSGEDCPLERDLQIGLARKRVGSHHAREILRIPQ